MSDVPSGKLKEQDLTNLDVTKLTPSSPEVISRQATINIGTIGHVAHGKSTIVKAVSGVQTVRFKNELERNITIKLDSVNDDTQQNTAELNISAEKKDTNFSSSLKLVRCPEENLDKIDAAILNAEKYLENSVHLQLPRTEQLLLAMELNSDNSLEGSSSEDQSNLVIEDNITAMNNSNFTEHNNGNSNIRLNPTSSNTNVEPNAVNIRRNLKPNSNLTNYDCVSDSKSTALDTAYLTIPAVTESTQVDTLYYYITSDKRLKYYILKGGMIDFDNTDVSYDSNEIDQIIDDEIIFGVHYYLIKWKNWSRGFNTWERFGVLHKSQKLVFNYLRQRKKNSNEYKPINGMHLMLSRKVISNFFKLFKSESGLLLPIIAPEDLSGLFNNLDIGLENNQLLREKCFKSYLSIIAFSSFRRQQLLRLKQWEIDINVVTKGHIVKVENNMDLEGPPDVFVYTTQCVPQNGIIIPNDPPIGCVCKKNCITSNNCCNDLAYHGSSVYDKNKNIIVAPGFPVFECNKKCRCTSSCTNRVVQLGSTVNVCIYRTRNYGWGVKTNQNIKKGQFIAKYIGEIITVDESECRLENKSSSIDNMWNLDFDDPQNYKYIIDNTHYANYTYFINHSCSANLNVYAVWIDCLDRNLPELALFAGRDILAGEQLTTNYFSRCNINSLKKNGTKCQCNMKNCKGYYF